MTLLTVFLFFKGVPMHYHDRTFPIGASIKRRLGLIEHHGIVGYYGHSQVVIHNQIGKGVHATSLEEFAASQSVNVYRVPRTDAEGYEIMQRALSQIGQPYDLFSQNCEHFVNWCVSGKSHSEQVVAGLMMLGLLGLIWWGSKRSN